MVRAAWRTQSTAEQKSSALSNNSNKFVVTVASLNSVARTLAIVVEVFVGLLATIARAMGLKP